MVKPRSCLAHVHSFEPWNLSVCSEPTQENSEFPSAATRRYISYCVREELSSFKSLEIQLWWQQLHASFGYFYTSSFDLKKYRPACQLKWTLMPVFYTQKAQRCLVYHLVWESMKVANLYMFWITTNYLVIVPDNFFFTWGIDPSIYALKFSPIVQPVRLKTRCYGNASWS